MPVGLLETKSYSAFAGVQDALIQWWYGHNAVGFFLTAGFLAMMYYFVPKRVERPVYSYRLSIVHFWSLIFIYIWAGPHHLHYTALPQWAQTLGMTFSIMLWMPSWGGMINGLMTLSGAWDKLRTDPVVRMMVVAIAFYGMATFEGPLMSIRAVNALSPLHRLDHRPRALRRAGLGRLHQLRRDLLHGPVAVEEGAASTPTSLVEWHFWIATTGILLYIAAMWVSGHHGGPDVARVHAAGLPRQRLRRDRRGQAHRERHPHDRGAHVPRRRADHVLQPVAHDPHAQPRRDAGACAPPRPPSLAAE